MPPKVRVRVRVRFRFRVRVRVRVRVRYINEIIKLDSSTPNHNPNPYRTCACFFSEAGENLILFSC